MDCSPIGLAGFLATVPGFSAVSAQDLHRLAQQMEVREFAAGEPLMSLGEPGDTLHVIRSGRVEARIRTEDGTTRTVATLGAGDVLGEIGLLTGQPRTADVIATGPVVSFVMSRVSLEPLLASDPRLARFLTEILGRRLERGGMERIGKYRLLKKIGEGASSLVYQALHPGLNRLVAVKMLNHALVFDAVFRRRFIQEARTSACRTGTRSSVCSSRRMQRSTCDRRSGWWSCTR